jgi:hypothetical protein
MTDRASYRKVCNCFCDSVDILIVDIWNLTDCVRLFGKLALRDVCELIKDWSGLGEVHAAVLRQKKEHKGDVQ